MTSTRTPGAPSWAEIGTTDVPAATAFYCTLFGWTKDELGPEAGGYGLLRKDGKQVAGIGPATDPARGTSWAIYFATEDVQATAAKVDANGGKIVVAPMEVMDQGSMAVFTDPQGAYFSVWQSGLHTGAELMREPGGIGWVELYTSDRPGAVDFYGAVLGTTVEHSNQGGEIYSLLSIDDLQIGGVFTPPDAPDMPPYWQVYIAVENCDASADKAIELGASEMLRMDYPGGRLAVLTDPQGGVFGILQGN